MTTHPILGPIASVHALDVATLEAIQANSGCSIPMYLVDINSRARQVPEQPVADKLADALDCFWNAALDGTRRYDDATANAVMNGMVQGIAAVAARLREPDAASLSAPPAQGEWVLVPREPTEAMLNAAFCAVEFNSDIKAQGFSSGNAARTAIYAAMLAAAPQPAPAPVQVEIAIGETIVVADLAARLAVKCADVVKALFKMGLMVTINQSIDHDTAVLVAEELGHKISRSPQPSAPGEAAAAVRTLTKLGYMYHGSELWKPPLGKPPVFDEPGEAVLQTLVKSMRLTATVGVPVKAVCVGRWAEQLAATATLAQRRAPDASIIKSIRDGVVSLRNALEMIASDDAGDGYMDLAEESVIEANGVLALIDQQQEARK